MTTTPLPSSVFQRPVIGAGAAAIDGTAIKAASATIYL
jgi:hypothetical protein